jgi:hypothetical protein
MPSAEFKPAKPAIKQLHIYIFDCMATGIGIYFSQSLISIRTGVYNIIWQRTTAILVGRFAGNMFKNSDKWYT